MIFNPLFYIRKCFLYKPDRLLVVPVFNIPPGLLAALVGTVLAQWYPHWELVLIDDASTSESLRHELAKVSDPRVRSVRLDGNLGIYGATNAGVAAAKHDWIVFADHDDVLINISSVLDVKEAAMACFASQLSLQRYAGQIGALNRFRTYTLPPEVVAAESFRIRDPVITARWLIKYRFLPLYLPP